MKICKKIFRIILVIFSILSLFEAIVYLIEKEDFSHRILQTVHDGNLEKLKLLHQEGVDLDYAQPGCKEGEYNSFMGEVVDKMGWRNYTGQNRLNWRPGDTALIIAADKNHPASAIQQLD